MPASSDATFGEVSEPSGVRGGSDIDSRGGGGAAERGRSDEATGCGAANNCQVAGMVSPGPAELGLVAAAERAVWRAADGGTDAAQPTGADRRDNEGTANIEGVAAVIRGAIFDG